MTEIDASAQTLDRVEDPFSGPSEEFFGEGDRARQLDELRHPARWSRRLLAVTGERGVGKSTLYRALSGRLDPGVKAARINANLTSDMREVLAGIVQGFGMAVPANADPQLLIALIVLHVREQIDADRYCLVLVDDAHLLELRALEQLLRLTDASADEGLRIAFFAEAHFVQSLDKAARRSGQLQAWHEIRLAPFTEEESRRYVAFRLAHAGLQEHSPFTHNQLAVIVGGSGGLPGRIDELASAILTGRLTIDDERRWLPRMHRAVVVLVLIGAGMGWLIFSNHHDGKSESAKQIPKGAQMSDAAVALALPQVDATRSTQQVGEAAAARKAPVPREAAASVTLANESAMDDDAPARDEPAAPAVASIRAPEPAQTLDSAPKVAPPRANAAGPVAALHGPKSAQWLRRQPRDRFTLQLLATSSREKRDQFVSRQARPEQFATFETRRNNEAWYAVTYGNFATRAEASAAAARLPSSVGRVEPWIRTFASVQATLD